eukprot:TRINITY_DN778240_c0_g1_i1.p1 TRINITY_DN778240_c0_g1~~TRINITY_DN778240_c0_g1_i1.p1  ORF type:complete len:166 (+),score=43.81 TRINITY_DN778240_c0_g1_i1:124-621(+)
MDFKLYEGLDFIESALAATSALNKTEILGLKSIFNYFDTEKVGKISQQTAKFLIRLCGLSVPEKEITTFDYIDYRSFLQLIATHHKLRIHMSVEERIKKTIFMLNPASEGHISTDKLTWFLKSMELEPSRSDLEEFVEFVAARAYADSFTEMDLLSVLKEIAPPS